MNGCYQVLGVDPKCTDKELRTAWKRLSMTHHPDRHKTKAAKDIANQRFARLSEAYSSIVREREVARPKAFRAPDVCIEVLATLEDAFRGRRISVMVPLRRLCEQCKTSEHMVACDSCDGEGSYVMLGDEEATAVFTDCKQCGGVGRVRPDDFPRCQSCLGLGIRSRTVEVWLKVPPGATGPCEVRAEGEGEDSLRCETRGDVLAFLQIPRTGGGFERVGRDLVYKARIDLKQALCGGSVIFEHLDGTLLQVPPVANDGVVRQRTIRLLEGLGMPSDDGPGDLVVCYEIDWPRAIDNGSLEKMVRALGQWCGGKRNRVPVRQNTRAVKEGILSGPPCKKSKLSP